MSVSAVRCDGRGAARPGVRLWGKVTVAVREFDCRCLGRACQSGDQVIDVHRVDGLVGGVTVNGASTRQITAWTPIGPAGVSRSRTVAALRLASLR